MKNYILNNSSTNPHAAADPQQPGTTQQATPLTADAVIEQIRALRAQLPAVAALNVKERRALRTGATNSEPIVQSSLNVIGVSGNVASALGQPVENVRAMQQDAIFWKAVEEEARNFVEGIAGANAIRRQKLARLGAQAYLISSQLAKDPENEVLVPHVEEIKRLKRIARRPKKPATPVPQQPSAAPATQVPSTSSPDASSAEKKA